MPPPTQTITERLQNFCALVILALCVLIYTIMRMVSFDVSQLFSLYETMVRIRLFEEKVAYFFSRALIHGTTHLYVGEEAMASGVCAHLTERDYITSTHRGHGHCIAKGIDINRMMAELFGKADGYCKGKGGSMHIADLSRGNLGANGIVGGGIAIAVGAALTIKKQKRGQVVVCFFGDGALNQGVFHEAVNMASIWKLPVLFVCENNQYGMSMSAKKAFNITNLAHRAKAYGIPGRQIDGNNVLTVYQEAQEALERVRNVGPMLLVGTTYRYLGHSKSDANRYRTKKEIEEWRRKDPIVKLAHYLKREHRVTEAELTRRSDAIKKEIENAVARVQELPYPDASTVTTDVYA